jgi:hypothetical protein
LGTRIKANFGLFGSCNCTRASQYIVSIVSDEFPDHGRGVRNRHCDFDDRDSAGADCVDGTAGFVQIGRANHRNNANFVNLPDGIIDCHDSAPRTPQNEILPRNHS